jgi:hypothetical protein
MATGTATERPLGGARRRTRMRDRFFAFTDRPMSWTRALIVGFIIWILAILLLGQLPSWIIYKSDQDVASIVDLTKKIPGVGKAGLNSDQIRIVRDMVANAVQMGAFFAMLVFAYIWQERKRKRTGGRGVQDVVKGYMPGK